MPPKSIFSLSTMGLKRSVNGSAAAAGACGPCSAASSLARSFASFLSFHSWEATIASQGGSQGQTSHPAGGDQTVYTYSYPCPWLLLGHPAYLRGGQNVRTSSLARLWWPLALGYTIRAISDSTC